MHILHRSKIVTDARAASRTAPALKSILLLLASLASVCAPGAVSGQESEVWRPGMENERPRQDTAIASFDSVSRDAFVSAHSFSLDHFLEAVAGYMLGREGPVGAPVRFSRFGMGLGRCMVYLDGISMNDPQDDTAPLTFIPTTSIGTLVFGRAGTGVPGEGIEGRVAVEPPRAPASAPEVAIELSKGNNDLKQRRVRFSSVRSNVGLDVAYDELLNDGYRYDAHDLVEAPNLGRFSSRVYSMRLRGTLAGGEEYAVSFTRFTGAFLGYALVPNLELRRSGHCAAVRTTLERLEIRAFQREFKTSLPDSSAENQTLGIQASYDLPASGGLSASLAAGFEDLTARQDVRGAVERPNWRTAHAGLNAGYAWNGFRAALDVGLRHRFSHATGWGGTAGVSKRLRARHEARVELKRNFRLPNLGEIFTPLHSGGPSDTVLVSGNRGIGGEHSIEVAAGLSSSFGMIHNDFGVSLVRVTDPVVPVLAGRDGDMVRTFGNGPSEEMTVVVERLRASRRVFGTVLGLDAGVMYGGGTKEYFCASVPRTKVDAEFTLGRDLFKPSSSALLTIQYQHCGSRRTGPGASVPPFDVLNLKLDVRLLDAHLYLMLINATDARYRTVDSYLMTPRTFVYGIEWTLFG